MRFNTLREKGYNLITIWECQWEKQKQDNPEIQAYVAGLDFVEPLNPRDAFAGGRTNAIKLYHAVKPNEKIHYVDYTSLYPWVNKTQRYPIGHPEFISNPGTTDVTRYFGFIKCKITAPYGLYHPVLPSKEGGKLTFPLCGACAREQLAKPTLERSAVCNHTESQRTMIGTWCTPEVEKAVEMGYEVQHIYEVWHFNESREGLFAEYVNTWLKVKQEASGWPSWCTTEALKQKYIRDYETKEGIKLEYEKIVKNDGLRAVAKIMLNNMWGKFGQNVNKTQIQEFDDPIEFHKFLDQDSIEVQQVSVVFEKVVEVYYKHSQHDIPVDSNLNIFVAAFTTCWARLDLYEALEMLDQRVVYFDTDSVVYLEDTDQPEQWQPEVGPFLGEFTDELDGEYIQEFVSGGPKNYGYLKSGGKIECKVRGFSLNVEGCKYLNYKLMRDSVIAEIQNPLDKPREYQIMKTYQIYRDPKTYTLETHPESKFYRLVYDKRAIDRETFKTYPYGYFKG